MPYTGAQRGATDARAETATGSGYLTTGVPSREAIEDLAARLTAPGKSHARMHFAAIGWILPELHDPDGHEVRLYTTTPHRKPPVRASRPHREPA